MQKWYLHSLYIQIPHLIKYKSEHETNYKINISTQGLNSTPQQHNKHHLKERDWISPGMVKQKKVATNLCNLFKIGVEWSKMPMPTEC